MDLRTTKRVIYGALYLIIWIGVFFFIYKAFFYRAPSCFDHIKDQGETGVDCGGPCAAACVPTNLPTIAPVAGVAPANPAVFPSGAGHYTFLAEVENMNSGFAAQSFDYEFDLFDASNTLIAKVPGQSFMYGGEVKYLVAANVGVASATVDHAALAIGNVDWVPASTLGIVPGFAVENLGAGPVTSSTVSVNGEITDNDVAAFDTILVVAVFKDANGTPIGASQTEIDAIAPGETQTFSVMYSTDPSIVPALTSLYAYAARF